MPLPVRRWLEVLSRLVGAQLIVGRALLRVLERLVGLGDFLELRLGVLLLGHVRMIFPGELAIRRLDLVGRGRFLDAQDRVVVLVFHWRGFGEESISSYRGRRPIF